MVGNITFSGLFSGISTDDIIEAYLSTRRTPINQLETQAELRGYERTSYQLVSLQASALKTALLNLRLQSTFLTREATSSAPSLLGVESGFNATPATHSVTIENLARGAKATSGLDDRSLERAGVKMAFGNTAGISAIAMTANSLGGTRAQADTLLTETLQAGAGAARITEGDRIQIDVTLKDGSTNTVYFTFNADGTDTLERLRQAVQSAFKGEAQVSIDSNGALVITETDPSGVNTISLDSLAFLDEDYSGSTFDISLGNTTAGNVATARKIVGTKTFTTGSSANIATGAELLTALDQWGGGSFSGNETIEISGTKYDGTEVSSSFTVDGTTTLNDLVTELQTLFNDAPNPPWETVVSIENGKIVLRDQVTGPSETQVSLYFYDPDETLDLQTGTFVLTEEGSDDISQTIRTSAFADPARGRHLVNATEGKAGAITGTVSLTADTILGSLGITETSLFTVDRDNGSGAVDPVTIFGINERSTVQDLIDAINAQAPGVTAQLVDDGGGSYNLQLLASEGGTDIRLTDDASGNGILENVLDPDTLAIDTDISTLDDSALASVESATTDTTDYTLTTQFTPTNGGPVQRRSVTDSAGTPVTDLISGAELQGPGNDFAEGAALIYANQSSELNVGPATSTYIFGARQVSDQSNTSTPPLNIYTTIDNSGIDIPITAGSFTINGVQINIDNVETTTIDEVIGLVNSSGAGVLMEYDSVHDRFLLHRPDAGNTAPITVGGVGDTSNFLTATGLTENIGAVQFAGTTANNARSESALAYANLTIPVVSGVFSINNVKITVNTAVDSLEDIIERINESPAGVIASYDENLDRLVLEQDLEEPPLFDRILIGSPTDTSNFWAGMRMTDTYQSPGYIGSAREKAELTVNGTSYTRDTNTVDDIINDVTFNLKGVSDDPIAVSIEIDTERATEAIRDFVVEYNKLVEIVDQEPLSDEERDKLEPLSDSERSQMTFTEIDEYELEREELWVRDYLYRSPTVNRLDSNLRVNLFSPVRAMDDDEISILSDLGITTGDPGLGVAAATSAFLVRDTTDPDEILQSLQGNTELQGMLVNDPEEVYKLFASEVQSTTEITGNIDISTGITLAAPMNFSIGNGSTQATVSLGVGFHTTSQVMSEITNQLAQSGLGEEIRVYTTEGGFLKLEAETDTGQARISIQDLGGGSNIANFLGIPSQTTTGTDALENAGLARRMDSFLDGYIGSGGLIFEKIKLGGLIDQELSRIAERIGDYEYRLALYELRLRRMFAQMEVAMAQFEQTSQFLEARLSSTTSSQQSSGSGLSLM